MSDAQRIAVLEATAADQASYLDTLASAVADYGSKFDEITMADMAQKVGPSPTYPGVPSPQSLTMGGDVSLAASTGSPAIGTVFKILATGTLVTPAFTGPGASSITAVHATGLTYRPCSLIYWLDASGVAEAVPTPFFAFDSAGAMTVQYFGTTAVVNMNETSLTCTTLTPTASAIPAQSYRYYILQEEAL